MTYNDFTVQKYLAHRINCAEVQYNPTSVKSVGKCKAASVMHNTAFGNSSFYAGKQALGRKGNEYFFFIFCTLIFESYCEIPLSVKAQERVSHHRRTWILIPGSILIHFIDIFCFQGWIYDLFFFLHFRSPKKRVFFFILPFAELNTIAFLIFIYILFIYLFTINKKRIKFSNIKKKKKSC